MIQYIWSVLWLLLISSSQLSEGACDATQLALIDNIAKHLDIKYEILKNFEPVNQDFDGVLGRMNFTNKGTTPITANIPWSIYLSSVQLLEWPHHRPNGTMLGRPPSSGLRVFHINGCHHRIDATSAFYDLNPAATLSVQFNASYSIASRTDVFPNWFVTTPDCPNDAKTILSTAGESLSFVSPFTTPQQWKRWDGDQFDPYTPAVRYDKDHVEDLGGSQKSIIPTPIRETLDQFKLLNVRDGGWVIIQPATDLVSDARFLADALRLTIVPDDSLAPTGRIIRFKIDASIEGRPGNNEAYRLDMNYDTQAINITGQSSHGVFHGIQSLLSLTDSDHHPGSVPHGEVVDYPRFDHRGQHLDVSRNFHHMPEVLRLLDVMATYKMNRFHFHLGDDEGWRIQIPDLPELTDVGGRRCFDPSGAHCIMPQFGSGPSPSSTGTGFYTVDEYKSILRYATQRHILVIPEIDSPGHGHAAINAMLARYHSLTGTNVEAAEEYLLSDLNDKSEYVSIQGYYDNAINPCLNSTYRFFTKVVSELKKMHDEAGHALQIYHFGGDEVPGNAWTQSPACEAFKRDVLGNPNATSGDIKYYFATTMSQIVRDAGIPEMSCWEDGLYAGGQMLNRSELVNDVVYSNLWDNVWEWGSGARSYDLANLGYKVILSHATHLYIDFPAEPDPEERGQYWATRIVPMKKVFGFFPSDIYENIDYDIDGNPHDKDKICANQRCPDLEKKENIVGIQGQLWSEQVRQSDQVDYMLYPRVLALAERAWHQAAWEDTSLSNEDELRLLNEDWTKFANTLGYKELARLDRIGAKYRVPPAGANVNSVNELDAVSGLPGLPIRYSTDNGVTWNDVKNKITLPPSTTVQLAVRSADGSRTSRLVSLQSNAAPTPPTSAANNLIASSNILLGLLVLFVAITRAFL